MTDPIPANLLVQTAAIDERLKQLQIRAFGTSGHDITGEVILAVREVVAMVETLEKSRTLEFPQPAGREPRDTPAMSDEPAHIVSDIRKSWERYRTQEGDTESNRVVDSVTWGRLLTLCEAYQCYETRWKEANETLTALGQPISVGPLPDRIRALALAALKAPTPAAPSANADLIEDMLRRVSTVEHCGEDHVALEDVRVLLGRALARPANEESGR